MRLDVSIRMCGLHSKKFSGEGLYETETVRRNITTTDVPVVAVIGIESARGLTDLP